MGPLSAFAGKLRVLGVMPDPDAREGRISAEAAAIGLGPNDSMRFTTWITLLPTVIADKMIPFSHCGFLEKVVVAPVGLAPTRAAYETAALLLGDGAVEDLELVTRLARAAACLQNRCSTVELHQPGSRLRLQDQCQRHRLRTRRECRVRHRSDSSWPLSW